MAWEQVTIVTKGTCRYRIIFCKFKTVQTQVNIMQSFSGSENIFWLSNRKIFSLFQLKSFFLQENVIIFYSYFLYKIFFSSTKTWTWFEKYGSVFDFLTTYDTGRYVLFFVRILLGRMTFWGGFIWWTFDKGAGCILSFIRSSFLIHIHS